MPLLLVGCLTYIVVCGQLRVKQFFATAQGYDNGDVLSNNTALEVPPTRSRSRSQAPGWQVDSGHLQRKRVEALHKAGVLLSEEDLRCPVRLLDEELLKPA